MRSIRAVSVILALFSLLLFSSCKKSENKTVTVSLEEKVQTESPYTAGKSSDRIKIAVAAVISPKETAIYYDMMMKYVADKLGRPVELIQRKTYQEVNDLLEAKGLDLAFVCSGPYIDGKKRFGMELLVAPLLYGKPFYQAYFIVPKDSSATGLKGLRGKRFAFTDPNSNTGKLVPTYMLSRIGEKPETFFKDIIYTYSHDNSIKAVSKGIVDGASVDGLIWEFFKDKNQSVVAGTKVVFKSPLYGIPPVVVHPDTPADVKEKLRKIFLGMHKDTEGKKILSELKIEKFIVPDDKSYDTVREMSSWLEKNK